MMQLLQNVLEFHGVSVQVYIFSFMSINWKYFFNFCQLSFKKAAYHVYFERKNNLRMMILTQLKEILISLLDMH